MSTERTEHGGASHGMPRSILPRERRDIASRKALVRRVRAEFDEVPGMCLTLAQAARLFDLDIVVCGRILAELMETGLLRLTPTGQYVNRQIMPLDQF